MKWLLFVIVLLNVVIVASSVELKAEADSPTALVRTMLTRELKQRDLVARGIDIIAVYRDGKVDIAVTDEQLEWVRSKTPMVVVLEREGLRVPYVLDENLGLYHTYDEMEAVLDSLAMGYPDLTSIDTLGTSIEGRFIRAIKISDNADNDEEEAEVFIMGCHHARELMSVEIPLLLAQYLLSNYGESPEVTRLVNEREVWIAPMINPDGHVYVQNHHSGDWWTWWRKNRRDNGDGSYGVDPNRNYSYMWGYDDQGSSPDPSSEVYRGTAPFSEPETQAVRDFCIGRSFAVALSYHSYGELILFPWGYAPIYTDDHELFSTLADSLQRGNDYTTGCTAMGNIYSTNGDTDDWAYGDTMTKNEFLCYTIELNSYDEGGFAPPEGLIQPTFQKVLDLNLTLIRRADDPLSVLGPQPPVLGPVTILNPPNYELSWSGGNPSDPNQPVSWELVEFKNLAGTVDPCETGDTLWVLDGFMLSSTRSYQGSYSSYSGSGNNLDNAMSMAAIYPLSLGETLSCWLWYDIEADWDYAYLEASLDQGLIWKTVPGNVTTDANPNGSNRGNGITGHSAGWIEAEFYLDSLGATGEDAILLVRFSYITDGYVSNEGMYVDMIAPVAYYETRTVLADSYPDTCFHRWPDETGEFTYFVRALDMEGQRSRRSNVTFHTVSDLTPAVAPQLRTVLMQNFPNPFNPLTTIRFTVGEEVLDRHGKAHVLLELYDVAGRRIAVLKEGRFASGVYSVTWDGRGTDGRILSSGVYFTRLAVGAKVFTRKIVLLR